MPSTLAYLEFVRKRENAKVEEKESLKTKEVQFKGRVMRKKMDDDKPFKDRPSF